MRDLLKTITIDILSFLPLPITLLNYLRCNSQTPAKIKHLCLSVLRQRIFSPSFCREYVDRLKPYLQNEKAYKIFGNPPMAHKELLETFDEFVNHPIVADIVMKKFVGRT